MRINLDLLSRDEMRNVFGGNSLDDANSENDWCTGQCTTDFNCSGKCKCVLHPSGDYRSCR